MFATATITNGRWRAVIMSGKDVVWQSGRTYERESEAIAAARTRLSQQAGETK